MRLFKAHAVMPRETGRPSHRVRSYVVAAEDWREARQRIASREPGALFVTVPDDMSRELMTDEWLISPRECADLRAACDWNEARLLERAIG